MVEFKNSVDLGKSVKDVKLFCKLTKTMEVPTEKDIVGDFANPDQYPGLAGCKWSRLCGFTFKSLDNTMFQFVYVPKLRGTLARNQRALSGWYCWTISPSDLSNKQVTSIAEVYRRFKFDINTFVHTDLFDKGIKAFTANIQYALDHQVKELLDQTKQSLAKAEKEGSPNYSKMLSSYNQLERYVKTIRASLALIDEVKQLVTPETKYDDSAAPDYARGAAPAVGSAKIAYNADKTYDLKHKMSKFNKPSDSKNDQFLAWMAARNLRIAARDKNSQSK